MAGVGDDGDLPPVLASGLLDQIEIEPRTFDPKQ